MSFLCRKGSIFYFTKSIVPLVFETSIPMFVPLLLEVSNTSLSISEKFRLKEDFSTTYHFV